MRALFFSLRPQQWVKNFFIFLPLIFGQKLFSFPDNLRTLEAFFLFSLAASAGYLINDIADFEKDKVHSRTRLRPIASGKLSVPKAKAAAWVLGAVSLSLSYLLSVPFGLIVTAYLLLNMIYSVFLKEIVILDVFCIGFLFILRVVAGGVVAGVELSHWIVVMTGLLALFLGFNKRRQELRASQKEDHALRKVLMDYNVGFIDQMIAIVTSSIVVAYMLYTTDARTTAFFGNKNIMLSIPFVYYGIFRYLYLIHRLNVEGDPTRILFRDRSTQLNLVLWLAICVFAIYGHLG
jgi:4-hydroxybenzoate polyprenyltransferase